MWMHESTSNQSDLNIDTCLEWNADQSRTQHESNPPLSLSLATQNGLSVVSEQTRNQANQRATTIHQPDMWDNLCGTFTFDVTEHVFDLERNFYLFQ